MSRAIEIAALRVVHRRRTALDGISLHVGTGEIVGLLGPNGAGKTTTVDVCCGLRRPTSGTVRVLGLDPQQRPRELRRQLGVMPQESGLYPELTGKEQLDLFSALYDVTGRTEVVLELVGLAGRGGDRVSTYSGGMRRRLALARALLHDPKVLFLDEPTLGVDVLGRRGLWDHISTLRGEGRSVLLTTNDLQEAAVLCDRVVIIGEGRVLADAAPAELQRAAGTTVLLGSAVPTAAAELVRPLALNVAVEQGALRCDVSDESAVAALVLAAAQAGPVLSVRVLEPSLEDVFVRLTTQ